MSKSVDPAVPAEMLQNMVYGHLPNILPYSMQDGYSRIRHAREFRVAVLENDILRATFLLEFGGRLWSLFHKPSQRELLSVNPVFQPANLALRNAWFSGGVEWNIGTIGHSPFTCSPLFAARVNGPDKTPVLRMYEWERIRQIPFQIDTYLPDGSPVLLVRVSLFNPHDYSVPMYWWSNIAVPERPATRVIVPASSAYRYTYDRLKVVPIPQVEKVDISYPVNIRYSSDFFFHIPEGQRPWITALDADGKGLMQVSTGRLKGRKLFVWGMASGGRHWQEFLSVPGQAYIEIQAGLARTQLEHLPMPANTEWAWLEAYGFLEADSSAVHGLDWKRATVLTGSSIEKLIPRATLEAEFERGASFASQPPAKIFQRGSGWGALERLRRNFAGESPFCSEGLVFDDQSLGTEQAPWVDLLHKGKFPLPSPDSEPSGTMVQREWSNLLEHSEGIGENWLALLHLGTMKYYQGDRVGARHEWERSQSLEVSPWALRNLAILDRDEKQFDTAATKYISACRIMPTLLPLALECGQFLIDAGYARQWLDLFSGFPDRIRDNARTQLLEAQAALIVGNLATVKDFFSRHPTIVNIREGEVSLAKLWFNYHAQRLSTAENIPIGEKLMARVRQEFPLPGHFDFRMADDN
ncbi:MAG TPA: DUF5107 domain-containing protein [Anaerolineales bacterium]